MGTCRRGTMNCTVGADADVDVGGDTDVAGGGGTGNDTTTPSGTGTGGTTGGTDDETEAVADATPPGSGVVGEGVIETEDTTAESAIIECSIGDETCDNE